MLERTHDSPTAARLEAAMTRLCDTTESFVVRRLDWAARELLSLGHPLRAWRLLRHARLRPETVAASGVDVSTHIAKYEKLEARVAA